jgi:serine/threonine protein phosphatase PrpC
VQAMGNQIQRQQETFQQMMQEFMRSWLQILNILHLPVAEQPEEGQQAFEQAFKQASEQRMQLAQQQQETFQQMSQQLMEQAEQQQPGFPAAGTAVVGCAYMERLRPSR